MSSRASPAGGLAKTKQQTTTNKNSITARPDEHPRLNDSVGLAFGRASQKKHKKT
jgi:hypothetical protein